MVRICSLEQYLLYHHKSTKTGEAIAVKKRDTTSLDLHLGKCER